LSPLGCLPKIFFGLFQEFMNYTPELNGDIFRIDKIIKQQFLLTFTAILVDETSFL